MSEFSFDCVRVPELLQHRFWTGVNISGPNGCWEWLRATRSGYGVIKFSGDYVPTHRLSYFLHNDRIPNGLVIGHKCDRRLCCNPFHLEAITYGENSKSAHVRGHLDGRPHGQVRGELTGTAKLTTSQVLEIRKLRQLGRSQVKIAKSFGVSKRTVQNIEHRRSWAHV